MLGGTGCFFSSAITLLVCWYIPSCLTPLMHQTQVFFPRNTTTEMGYQVKPQSPTPNSRSSSNYSFIQPTSPKSPANFVQYHQRYRAEYPPMEVDYIFPRRRSRSRTGHNRGARSLDFEVGAREDGASTSSEVPSYHQYPEEWEYRGRGRSREREYPKADLEAAAATRDGYATRVSMTVLGTRPRRGEVANQAPRPTTNLHPYVGDLTSTLIMVLTDNYGSRSPPSHLLLVSDPEDAECPKLIDRFCRFG